jgi:hypothetical protein
MKESLRKIDPRIIFRETFADEQSVRVNNGIPTAVTFSNGVAQCVAANSSKIYYSNLNLKGTYSVRIKFTELTPLTNGFLVDFTTLQTTLGGASVAGGKMKKEGTSYWISPNTGADNSSGFTALGGGIRLNNGNFATLGSEGYFFDVVGGYIIFSKSSTSIITGSSSAISKLYGCSLRFIKS